jgi:peroxygenase
MSSNGPDAQQPTRLEQHVDFWDRDEDRVIWPVDTYIGFYQLGFGFILSIVATFIIHGSFSYPTQDTWLPDPMFRIYIDKINRLKHGSDTGAYRRNGTFSREMLDDFFTRASSQKDKDTISVEDTVRGLVQQRNVGDLFGWFSAAFEWLTVWYMLWPKDGKLAKKVCAFPCGGLWILVICADAWSGPLRNLRWYQLLECCA